MDTIIRLMVPDEGSPFAVPSPDGFANLPGKQGEGSAIPRRAFWEKPAKDGIGAKASE